METNQNTKAKETVFEHEFGDFDKTIVVLSTFFARKAFYSDFQHFLKALSLSPKQIEQIEEKFNVRTAIAISLTIHEVFNLENKTTEEALKEILDPDPVLDTLLDFFTNPKK